MKRGIFIDLLTDFMEFLAGLCCDNPYVRYHVEDNPKYWEHPDLPPEERMLHSVYSGEEAEIIVVTRGKWLYAIGSFLWRLS